MFKWALGTVDAIHSLHHFTPSIMHRDLKSLNVLITADDTAKVNFIFIFIIIINSYYHYFCHYSLFICGRCVILDSLDSTHQATWVPCRNYVELITMLHLVIIYVFINNFQYNLNFMYLRFIQSCIL